MIMYIGITSVTIRPIGMKTKRKRTELSAIIFVFTFFCRSGNEYRNPGNEYGNKYYQKEIWTEYKADTKTEVGIDRNLKTPLIIEKYTKNKQI